MPLGKVSNKQIKQGYQLLTEAANAVAQLEASTSADTTALTRTIIDASNRFYTLIPHDTGIHMPPVLDNNDLIKVSCLSLFLLFLSWY